jgi:hypothetical protein
MYRLVGLLVGVLAVTLPLWAMAAILEIPIPIESPDFQYGLEFAEFEIVVPLQAVTQISLRLVGSYQEVIYVDMSNPWNYGSMPIYLDMVLGDDVAAGAEASERHQFPEGAGEFDFERILLDRESGDWSFLLDGVGQVGVDPGPKYIQSYDGSIASAASSWGTLTEATLIVTYDMALPAEGKAWGSVKALFR